MNKQWRTAKEWRMQINGDERRFAATHLLALRHKNDHTIASSVIWGFSFSLFFSSIKARTLFFFRCILTHSGSKQQRIGTYELDYLPIYLPVYSNCSFNLAPHRLLHLYLFILSLTPKPTGKWMIWYPSISLFLTIVQRFTGFSWTWGCCCVQNWHQKLPGKMFLFMSIIRVGMRSICSLMKLIMGISVWRINSAAKNDLKKFARFWPSFKWKIETMLKV